LEEPFFELPPLLPPLVEVDEYPPLVDEEELLPFFDEPFFELSPPLLPPLVLLP
jgi:hypothetical protein